MHDFRTHRRAGGMSRLAAVLRAARTDGFEPRGAALQPPAPEDAETAERRALLQLFFSNDRVGRELVEQADTAEWRAQLFEAYPMQDGEPATPVYHGELSACGIRGAFSFELRPARGVAVMLPLRPDVSSAAAEALLRRSDVLGAEHASVRDSSGEPLEPIDLDELAGDMRIRERELARAAGTMAPMPDEMQEADEMLEEDEQAVEQMDWNRRRRVFDGELSAREKRALHYLGDPQAEGEFTADQAEWVRVVCFPPFEDDLRAAGDRIVERMRLLVRNLPGGPLAEAFGFAAPGVAAPAAELVVAESDNGDSASAGCWVETRVALLSEPDFMSAGFSPQQPVVAPPESRRRLVLLAEQLAEFQRAAVAQRARATSSVERRAFAEDFRADPVRDAAAYASDLAAEKWFRSQQIDTQNLRAGYRSSEDARQAAADAERGLLLVSAVFSDLVQLGADALHHIVYGPDGADMRAGARDMGLEGGGLKRARTGAAAPPAPNRDGRRTVG